MSDHPKRQVAALGSTIVLVAFLWLLCQSHMCDLHSLWIEIPILFWFVAMVLLWARHGVDFRQVLSRCMGVLALMFAVEVVYLGWLHSDLFPRWLLLPRPSIRRSVPNHPAAGKARSALQIAIGCVWPGVPEPRR